MILSYQWLCEYLPEILPLEELSNILTSVGLEVEAAEPVETIKGGLEGLVTGEVLTCEKHPNADKLKVTTVNIGGEAPLHIVCGAANVAAGQKVIVAPAGAMVHPVNGKAFPINKTKIRGADSEGMICAEDEIGLGESHAGIMVLPDNAIPGTPAKVYFKLPEPDYAIHIGLTPNRSDAMSHIGVAKDVCAYLSHHRGKKLSVKLPAVNRAEKGSKTIDIKINIADTTACPRYAGLAIAGVVPAESPAWLKQRLQTIGVRAINNIVDATNYVLHEYGQPLHAFDADKINGSQIKAGFVAEGTQFVTLDEKNRTLSAEDLVISDAAGPIALAGVFGGQHSGISDHTTNIFLESAYFNPSVIRRASLKYGLRTDAATHFEKGVDINNVVPALQRAAALIIALAGGSIASGICDEYPAPLQQPVVTITYAYIEKISGKHYAPETIKDVLLALGFEILAENTESLRLKAPSNKMDVQHPADIMEEILRIDGLDNIAIPGRLNIALVAPLSNDRKERERLAELLFGMGMQEIVTNSIVNSKFYANRNDLVRMLNSLSSELDVMRPAMLESGLEVIQYNCNRKNNDLMLFEFGKIYTQQSGKYIEEPQLALWITGNAQPGGWQQKPAKADIYYLKGIINNLLLATGIDRTTTEKQANGTQAVNWIWNGEILCTAENVSSSRLQEFEIKQDVCYARFHWQVLLAAIRSARLQYSEIPKFPMVSRDLAIITDKSIPYAQIKEVTDNLQLHALKSFSLFDIFESEKIGVDKKSYALTYNFQLPDKTLTDQETDQLMQQLANAYKNRLQAQIRE